MLSRTQPFLPNEGSPEIEYDRTRRALHWIVAVVLACQFVTALLLPHIELDSPLDATTDLHFNFGLIICLLMAVRLAYRRRRPVQVAPGMGSNTERTVATWMHRLFYLILLVGPFFGWMAASAHSVPVRLLGIVTLPPLAPRNAQWGYLAGDLHGYTMWALLFLVTCHAVAALYHHFVRHDNVLRRML